MSIVLWILFVVFVLLQIADAWTTTVIISNGIGKETNSPTAAPMQLIGRYRGLVVAKLLGIAGAALLTFWAPRTLMPRTFVNGGVMVVVVLAYCCVVWRNWLIIKKSGLSIKGLL